MIKRLLRNALLFVLAALMLGIALALGGAVTLIVVKRKKKDQEV